MDYAKAVDLIAERVLTIGRPHPVRVGVDGRTAAGKTTLANALGEALEASGRQVIRTSVDDFHRPPEERYRRGRDSAAGYYLDTIDYPLLRDRLLLPLGPDGTRRHRAGSFGQPDGARADFPELGADDDTIAIVDGVFLFRPELNDCWEYRVFVEITQATSLERGVTRDAVWMGSAETAMARYEARYLRGEGLYLDAVRPWELADVVVENGEPAAPGLRFRAHEPS